MSMQQPLREPRRGRIRARNFNPRSVTHHRSRNPMSAPENFMRAPALATPKRTLFTEAMEIFHRAADLIELAPRVRLELEEPDYEHIFYVTVKLKDRLVPLAGEAAKAFTDLA